MKISLLALAGRRSLAIRRQARTRGLGGNGELEGSSFVKERKEFDSSWKGVQGNLLKCTYFSWGWGLRESLGRRVGARKWFFIDIVLEERERVKVKGTGWRLGFKQPYCCPWHWTKASRGGCGYRCVCRQDRNSKMVDIGGMIVLLEVWAPDDIRKGLYWSIWWRGRNWSKTSLRIGEKRRETGWVVVHKT